MQRDTKIKKSLMPYNKPKKLRAKAKRPMPLRSGGDSAASMNATTLGGGASMGGGSAGGGSK